MNVCDNLGDHLVGNVYVKVLSLLLYVLCLCGLISNILENGGDVKCYVKLLFFSEKLPKKGHSQLSTFTQNHAYTATNCP